MAYDIHPSEDIKGSIDDKLSGKKIVLCITGSVAAVRSSEIGRLLIRHGADVFPVMSEAACRIIHPDLMHWACGHEPITRLTGKIEHVALAGNVEDNADLILIAPATANTIGKIANGIDDTPVTTFATTAIGEGIPVIIVPAMHKPMYQHPFVRDNIKKIEGCGIKVMMPRIEEGKAKIPENEEIYTAIENFLYEKKKAGSKYGLRGKKLLVTAGRTVEYIDPIRVITNNSSGKMGVALAEAALKAGAEVTLIAGKITITPDEKIKTINCETAEEMYSAVHKELKEGYDIVAAAAAVGDWQPVKRAATKISTHDNENISIELRPTPKIIDSIKKVYPDIFLLAFRALHDLSDSELQNDAEWRMNKAGADMIAVNDVSRKGAGFESDTNEMFLLSRSGPRIDIPMTTKVNAASTIIEVISQNIK
jgi:phosphopantothenoylcysteine decarboxylase/phosphopantothenate--cysteine ligase